MANEEQEVKGRGRALRRALRTNIYALSAILFALLADQFLWLGPRVGDALTVTRFDSRCRAIKPGMSRVNVIGLMNDVANLQYSSSHQLAFYRDRMHGSTGCIVELDDADKVQTIKTENVEAWNVD